MEPLSLSTEGLSDAEQMLLSMIVSFASEQLKRNWTLAREGDGDVVMYDITNSRARLAWERNRSSTHPISVTLSEDPMPDVQWVLQKPVRTQHLIPFLNALAAWMEQENVMRPLSIRDNCGSTALPGSIDPPS